MFQNFRFQLARILCRYLPPIISQRIRAFIYPRSLGIQHNHTFTRKSITGSKLKCSTQDFHAYPFSIHGYYDWRNIAIASALATKGDTILEIGANIGTETACFSDIVGKEGKVYAFEPLPSNIITLTETTSLSINANTTILPYALSDSNQICQFNIPSKTASGTGYLMHQNKNNAVSTIMVQCMTLDSIAHEVGIASIIFCDTEGEEVKVLRGASAYIKKNLPILVLEANPRLLGHNAHNLKDLYDELRKLNYLPYKISRLGISKIVTLDSSHSSNWICFDTTKFNLIDRVQKQLFLSGVLPCISKINPMIF